MNSLLQRISKRDSLQSAKFETEKKSEPSRETLEELKKAFVVLRLNYRALWKLKYPIEKDEIRDLQAIAKLIADIPPDVIPEAMRNVAMEIPSPPAVKTFAQYCFDVFEQRRQSTEPVLAQDEEEPDSSALPIMSFEDRRNALAKLKEAVNFESLGTKPEPTATDQKLTPSKYYVPVREVDLFSRAGLQALMGAGEDWEGLKVKVGEGGQIPNTDFFAFLLDVFRYSYQSGFDVNSKIAFELKEALEWKGLKDTESNRAELIRTLETLASCRALSPSSECQLIENLQVSGSHASLVIGNELWTLLTELVSMPTLDSISWIR